VSFPRGPYDDLLELQKTKSNFSRAKKWVWKAKGESEARVEYFQDVSFFTEMKPVSKGGKKPNRKRNKVKTEAEIKKARARNLKVLE